MLAGETGWSLAEIQALPMPELALWLDALAELRGVKRGGLRPSLPPLTSFEGLSFPSDEVR